MRYICMRIFMCQTVVVAQLVRAPDCGSGGRRFETDLPPVEQRDYRNVVPFLFLHLHTICTQVQS